MFFEMPQNVERKMFYNVAELSRFFGVDKRTVVSWQYRSGFPAGYQMGSSLRWRADEIETWLNQQRVKKNV